MADPRTDEIAREAARLINTGRSDDINTASRQAANSLGYSDAPLPGAGRVRKHAQAMSMQALGEAGYQEERLKVWQIAEQVMTVFEHTMPDAETLLVGRAAHAHIDAGLTIHIRIYTRHSDRELARSLFEFGYGGNQGHDELRFQTVETKLGRMQQIRFTEEGYEVAVTRCMPELSTPSNIDLVSGKPIQTLSLKELRRQLDEPF